MKGGYESEQQREKRFGLRWKGKKEQVGKIIKETDCDKMWSQ